jgi:hypothetical protein
MKDDLDIAKYRWEFIRRNDEYQKDWNSFFADPDIRVAKKLLEKWGFYNFPQSSDLNKTWDNIRRPKGDMYSYEQRKSSIWPQINDLIIQKVFRYSSNRPSYGMEPDLISDITIDGNFVFHSDGTRANQYYLAIKGEHTPLIKSNIPKKIVIIIDRFDKYLYASNVTKHAFRGRVLDFINQKMKLWEVASRKLKLSPKRERRHRFNWYDDHLRVWELVNQHGMKWKKIAKIIDPSSGGVDRDINRVKASYRQACNLIKNAKDIFAEK